MRSWKPYFLLLIPTLCLAAQPDRIAGPIDSSQMVQLKGNVHSLARTEFDQGRADGGRLMSAVSLVFKPSAAQQTALNNLLAQQQDASSPNYHKWLTPAEFAERFGMSQNDIDQVVSWLQSQGLTVTRIANSRNQVFIEGTVAQIEAAFRVEIHNYLVDGELHYANAGEPSIPAALSGIALAVQNLHNFQPKPRAIFRNVEGSEADPNFTSHLSGNHFVTPGDFTTIYDLQPLYTSGTDGTGQKIALTGQSSINLADVANFRSAAGLAANVPTLLLEPGTGTSTRCPGDEGESDLDVEWSGAIAKNASITLVYAGLVSGDTCTNRQFGAFNALQYAIDQKIAPIISNSYGNCEAAVTLSSAQSLRLSIQQANTQGQTVMSASGDSGAADCDFQVKSATHGLAVDIPAAIPEVTGMGGTEFNGDAAATVTGGNASTTTYWKGTTGGTDTISSALSHIPEMGWNDTANPNNTGGDILASGGGASIFFSKPSWQTGTGVPNDGKRDVPDLALNASPDHDPYLFCSEDGANGAIQASCTSGFRTGSGENLTAVGGTSAAAPTFAGVLALISQHLGSSGLGNINPTLYQLAASNPTAFHDVPASPGSNNIVPCTSGTTGCPASAPFQYGFSTGTGYDQVTGLGSVDVSVLAQAWAASLSPDFQLTAGPLAPTPLPAGQSAADTLTISAVTGSTGMVVNFAPSSCTGLPAGATCSFNPPSVTFDGTNPATTTVTISTVPNMALPSGAQTITITPTNSSRTTTTVSLSVSATTEAFTLSSTASTFPVGVGGTAQIPITVNSTTGFINSSNGTTVLPLTYSCSGIPATSEISCQVSNNGQPTNASSVTISLVTTPVTTELVPPPLGRSRIFYAVLLPGFFGIVFMRRSTRGLRMLGMIVVLGFSTLWLGACGGSSNTNTSLKNAGTPPGNYVVTISATTGGASPITNSNAPFTVTLTVAAQ
ncbi:MAG: protease pro-enzyme activation domain-containing protein [Candidatus Sulfotelmatobacter sp.]